MSDRKILQNNVQILTFGKLKNELKIRKNVAKTFPSSEKCSVVYETDRKMDKVFLFMNPTDNFSYLFYSQCRNQNYGLQIDHKTQ